MTAAAVGESFGRRLNCNRSQWSWDVRSAFQSAEYVTAALETAVLQARQRRSTDEWLVNRAIARGHVAEATDFYLRFALASLVRLVRAEHCPWRWDFGLRYLREDLPADVADRVEALIPGHSSRSLRELSGECFGGIDELLAQRQP